MTILTLLCLLTATTCNMSFHKDIFQDATRKAHTVPDPYISPRIKGYYKTTETASITLNCSQASATIHYSQNNGLENPYLGAINITTPPNDTQLSFYATYPDYNPSNTIYSFIHFVPSGNIFTVAGGNNAGSWGDSGLGYDAALNAPAAVTFTGSAMYIADTKNNRIRMLDSDGYISTFAGTGTAGVDDGPRLTSTLARPNGICADTIGNLYFTDAQNNRVRKIDVATGLLSTIAINGDPTPIALSTPSGICYDSSLNCLYVADTGHDRLIQIDFSTGLSSIIADSSAPASLSGPTGLFLNSTNTVLFIADTGTHQIKKMVLSTSSVTIVAGTGTAGFNPAPTTPTASMLNGPTGIWVNGAETEYYIADTGNHRIRHKDPLGSFLYVLAGVEHTSGVTFSGNNSDPALAILNSPQSVFVDSAGTIYITDTGNNRIRIIPKY